MKSQVASTWSIWAGSVWCAGNQLYCGVARQVRRTTWDPGPAIVSEEQNKTVLQCPLLYMFVLVMHTRRTCHPFFIFLLCGQTGMTPCDKVVRFKSRWIMKLLCAITKSFKTAVPACALKQPRLDVAMWNLDACAEQRRNWLNRIFEETQIRTPTGTVDSKRVQYLKMLNKEKT